MQPRQLSNLAADFAGLAAGFIFPLVFNVIYFQLLGSESYGLITFYTTLVLTANLLDLGLTHSTVREFARRWDDPLRSGELRTVLFTLQLIFFGIGLVLGLLVMLSSKWFATSWLQSKQLSTDEIATAISLMGGMLWLMFSGIIFHATLRGMKRLVLGNTIGIVTGVCRGAITIALLFALGATPYIFFSVQLALAAFEIVILGVVAWTLLPRSATRVHFDVRFLRSILHFSAVNGAAVLIGSLMLIGDRIILSTLLPLDLFGQYGLAVAAASVVLKLTSPFSGTYFPYFVELAEKRSDALLSHTYYLASQSASALVLSIGILIAAYAGPITFLLSGNADTAARLTPVLAMLAIANTLNALMWLPHALQLASGAPGIGLRINIFMSVLYLPSLALLVPSLGIYAPGVLWLAVNLLNVPIFILMTHRVALRGEAWGWFKSTILIPGLAAAMVVTISVLLAPTTVSWIVTVSWLGLTATVTVAVALLCAPKTRALVRSGPGHIRRLIGA